MTSTPAELLESRHPLFREFIDKLSKNFGEKKNNTKDMNTKWPEGGKFDVALCEEIETLIKNYKVKDKRKRGK